MVFRILFPITPKRLLGASLIFTSNSDEVQLPQLGERDNARHLASVKCHSVLVTLKVPGNTRERGHVIRSTSVHQSRHSTSSYSVKDQG